jgi:nicotinamidase-related amidase
MSAATGVSAPQGVRVGGGRLDSTSRPALVMVDCQRLFTLGGSPGTRLHAAAVNAGKAAATAREFGLPVVWLRTIYHDASEIGPVWRVKAPALSQLRPDDQLAGFDNRVGYREGEPVVTKKRASGFVGTGLDALLRDLGVRTLAVAGFTTGGCVRATVVDAASLDYLPVILPDAMADRSQEIHDAALVDLDARYGDVIDSSEWFVRVAARN